MPASWWDASLGSLVEGSAERLSTWSDTGEAKRCQQGFTQPWDCGSWIWTERGRQCVEKGNECSHGKEVVTDNASATECAITTRAAGKRSTTFPGTECDESPTINGKQPENISVSDSEIETSILPPLRNVSPDCPFDLCDSSQAWPTEVFVLRLGLWSHVQCSDTRFALVLSSPADFGLALQVPEGHAAFVPITDTSVPWPPADSPQHPEGLIRQHHELLCHVLLPRLGQSFMQHDFHEDFFF
jgi:hypothetical protein